MLVTWIGEIRIKKQDNWFNVLCTRLGYWIRLDEWLAQQKEGKGTNFGAYLHT